MEYDRSFQKIPVELIDIPEIRASSKFTEEQMAYFRATAEKYGILQPILVRRKDDSRYELIGGKSRLTEQIAQGKQDVEAIVIDAPPGDSLMMHIAENLARGETDPLSVAKVIDQAVSQGVTEEDIAKATGHTVEWVKFYRGLLKLPQVYQDALEKGELSLTAIREALRLNDPKEIDYCLTQALRLGWSGGVVKQYVDRRLDELRMAEARAKVLGEPQPAPEPDAEKLIKYEKCMLCNRTVFREQCYMNIICEDCKTLVQYIIDNVGPPDKALDVIYKALDKFYRYQEYLKMKAEFEPTEGS